MGYLLSRFEPALGLTAKNKDLLRLHGARGLDPRTLRPPLVDRIPPLAGSS